MNSIKNPFNLEDLRHELAKKENLKAFKKTYSKSRGINKNTGIFWDKKFRRSENYKDQDPMTKDKINTIISFLPDKKTRILDLGMGQGYLEQRLKQLGIDHELYGIDISKTSIIRATNNFKGEFFVGDVMSIDKIYRRRFFDVVLGIEIIEHISPRKIFTFYRDIYNLLKPGGIFIVSTPLNEGIRYMKENPNSHVREYTEPILRAEFEISRFKVIDERFFFAFRKFYRLKRLLSKIFKNRWEANNIVIKAVKE